AARFMDPSMIRFTTVDPLAEKYFRWSPYVYVANNPLRFIDPTGMSPEDDERQKKENESFWQGIYNAFNQMMEGVLYTVGLHNDQINSEDASVRSDAADRRTAAAEAIDNVNETVVSLVPGGLTVYKALNNKEITKTDIAWEVATILPVGKIGKLGKYAEKSFFLTRHGELTNGIYTVSQEAMKKHIFDGVAGKNLFYPTLNANEVVLKAAQHADNVGLWIGNKAKVPVLNTNIGTLGNGKPTNIINVYRNSNGFIHGSPGSIR
ncbi:MAG: RHS repeat-associated core domain-containing protein, partial [Dysgonomonas sp.]|uniref:RHS repeat domain-containing protein n=1 Tax=Dysgonomonas sp. TaxID=1891233 RepID=UPI0039E64B2D